MTFEELVSGTVFAYPFLWAHQAERGETEGRKDRPVVVGIRLRPEYGQDRVLLLPITSKAPQQQSLAVEIPDSEKRRGGLDVMMRLWIVIDDINIDEPGHSYFLSSQRPLGRFSNAWFLTVMRTFIKHRRAIRATDRTR
jgi:hypothetical protein